MDAKQLSALFQEQYGSAPGAIVRAPGRVNLIGEHIDYNGGPVLPIAIDRHFLVAGKKREDRTIRLRSLQEKVPYEGSLPVQGKQSPAWANYPLGVIHEFQKRGKNMPGMDVLITSDVPLGSGLSSSAAFEVATACLLLELSGESMPRLDLARLCQRAENQFVGVNCGLMDQAASACCKSGHAMLLDCATPSCSWRPMPDAAVVVAHCGVRRGLSASAYNERRSQCEESLRIINQKTGRNYPNLCSVPVDLLPDLPHYLDDIHLRRTRHVIGETDRVQKAIDFFQQGKNAEAGEALNQSHYSLRDDYEVSCTELDELTEMCRGFDGVYGSRLTGAGFGGCTVTLADPVKAESLVDYLKGKYYRARNLDPVVFVTRAADGAGTVESIYSY